MRSRWLAFSMLVGGLMSAGCDTSQPFVTPERLDKGLVMVLTGIEGRSDFNREVCRGLDAGGVPYAIELVDWTWRVPGLYLLNLRAERRNRAKAEEIAQRILRYRMTYPGRPVVLVGQSGGGAIAVWAAEALQPGVKVDGIILLAAALSPDYMLDMALYNSNRGIVNFYSHMDVVFLLAGTTLAGTMDGVHTSSAGRLGFNVPTETVRPTLYRRLYQVGWNTDMERTGHWGLHLTSGSSQFVSQYVAPLVLLGQWSNETLKLLVEGKGPSLIRRAAPAAVGAAPARAPERAPAPTRPARPAAPKGAGAFD